MNGNSEALLRAILTTTARQAFPVEKLSEIVLKGGGDKQLQAFNLCDGTKSQGEIARCSVPECRDAILTGESEDALWQSFFTAAPAQRREFEPSSKRRKRRPAPSPSDTA